MRTAVVALAPCAGLLSLLLTGCADHDHAVVISVPEQRMVVLERGVPLAVYPVSTSKFGLGDVPGRGLTPLGELEIADKIGDGAPPGAVIKSRQRTGEIVAIDAPGRDAIVTRILWLRGMEGGNRNAYGRYIYIHGTPEERDIGRPVSYGCVRMRSRDHHRAVRHCWPRRAGCDRRRAVGRSNPTAVGAGGGDPGRPAGWARFCGSGGANEPRALKRSCL